MTAEPQRLQYLEAMGLTAWCARYRLPNARPTLACEWPAASPAAAEPTAPGERLHALLDEAAQAQVVTPRPPPAEAEPRHRPAAGRARALLGDLVPVDAEQPAPAVQPAASTHPPGEALRFTWQMACLEGRWLIVLPADTPPDAVARRLLGNLLQAAGVASEQLPSFETFRWPQLEGLPVEAPLEEAREGLQAFLAGQRRRGWAPERLLVFGEDATLTALLALADGRCPLLSLPAWQGPSLNELAASGAAKRALWPQMAGWREAWRGDDAAD